MSIADAVASASAYLTEHPAEARYRDSAATARLQHGLVVAITGASGETASTDMPTGIGGTATVPSPGWLMRAAAASCVVTLIGIRAAAIGVDLAEVEITVDSESDDRGILGLDPEIPAGALTVRVAAHVRAPGMSAAAIDELIRWAVDHCPVTDTFRRVVPIEVVISA